MKLIILTLTLITAVTINCRDRIKPPETLPADKESKSSDLIRFETLVGTESTLKPPKDTQNKFHEIPKCKPSKRCLEANGKCGYKKWCKGRIIRNGCRSPKGCRNSICCAPALTTPIFITTKASTREEVSNTQQPTTTEKSVTDDPPIISVDKFLSKFNKTYENEEEAKKRIAIFQDNVKEMEDHNALYEAGNSSFIMGVNEYSDLTYDEFIHDLTGAKESNISQRFSTSSYTPKDIGEEPSYLDYREWGALNPIRHQHSCGSCWAFSAIGSIESNLFLKRGILLQLSEQELVDCDEASDGCNGGNTGRAIGYVIDQGISYEDEYPYTAKDGTCNKDTRRTSLKVKSLKRIAYGSDTNLLNALVHIGPITVAVWVSKNFQRYKKGVLEDDICKSVDTVNHAVVLVGYGTENGKDYWLIRNSWGESWGENGYIKLSRDVQDHCSISKWGYVPIIEDPCTLVGGASIGGQCLIFNEELNTWDQAVASCEAKGQRLAILRNPVVVNAYLQNNYDGERFWLGGSDINLEDTWTWINGQSMASFPWGPGQPDDFKHNEDCLEWGYKGNYNDERCTKDMRYICEHDPCLLLGGISIAGQCLIFNEEPKTWAKAVSSCEAKGQQLAVLQDPVAVHVYMQNNYDGERFWLGGSDINREDTWTWINGQSMASFPWGPGQPNDWQNNEDCLEWGWKSNYNDDCCTNDKRYICEHV